MKKIIFSIAILTFLAACEGQADGTKTGNNGDQMKKDNVDRDIMKSNSADPGDSATAKMDTAKVIE